MYVFSFLCRNNQILLAVICLRAPGFILYDGKLRLPLSMRSEKTFIATVLIFIFHSLINVYSYLFKKCKINTILKVDIKIIKILLLFLTTFIKNK